MSWPVNWYRPGINSWGIFLSFVYCRGWIPRWKMLCICFSFPPLDLSPFHLTAGSLLPSKCRISILSDASILELSVDYWHKVFDGGQMRGPEDSKIFLCIFIYFCFTFCGELWIIFMFIGSGVAGGRKVQGWWIRKTSFSHWQESSRKWLLSRSFINMTFVNNRTPMVILVLCSNVRLLQLSTTIMKHVWLSGL